MNRVCDCERGANGLGISGRECDCMEDDPCLSGNTTESAGSSTTEKNRLALFSILELSKAGRSSSSPSSEDFQPLRTPSEWRSIGEVLAETEKNQRPDLLLMIKRQWLWSRDTFGNGRRTGGVIQHIRKELNEIEQKPDDLEEWVDVIILALDGFWRHGGTLPKLLNVLWLSLIHI